jgi:hypothetical protein
MDPTSFDALTRSLGATGSRRRLLGLVSALLPAGLLTAWLGEDAGAAERPLDRLQRRTPQRNRQRRNNRRQSGNDKDNNNKQNIKDQNNGPGAGRPLDCPDATISCFSTHNENCQDVVGQIGPVGRCGHGLSCCPCESSDQTYWNTRCNQAFPAKCNGTCFAEDDGLFSSFVCQV